MERNREFIDKYGSFAWWVFMAVLAVFGIVAGALQGGFFGICGIIGCTISAVIFGWQAYGEWLDAKQS